MTRESHACRICSAEDGHRIHDAPETMFGTGESFHYLECGACGCLQLLDEPVDMAPYYPEDYYSFEEAPNAGSSAAEALPRRLRLALMLRTAAAARLYRNGPDDILRLLSGHGVTTSATVLDVGCGAGDLLASLARQGFRHLLGIDAFVAAPARLYVKRMELAAVADSFDLVMFNHALEHMPDQVGVLSLARARLKPRGLLLVRIPVAGSDAWKRYGVSWVQLDPPRHLYLHTVASMTVAAEAAGLRVDGVTYDSTAFQFWGSEQILRGIPLRDPRSRDRTGGPGPFSAEELSSFETEARRANEAGRGDQAAFFLSARR